MISTRLATFFVGIIAGCTLLLSGCGYRFGVISAEKQAAAIYVPYVEGDIRGILTDALINALALRGIKYRSGGADLTLCVSLFEPQEETIGFAFAPKEKGGFSHVVVSNEARFSLSATLTLIDNKTATPILGPVEIRKSIDYDYESDLSTTSSNAFSLGQLKMHNSAQEAAHAALSPLLAEKIADYVVNSW